MPLLKIPWGAKFTTEIINHHDSPVLYSYVSPFDNCTGVIYSPHSFIPQCSIFDTIHELNMRMATSASQQLALTVSCINVYGKIEEWMSYERGIGVIENEFGLTNL